ncbi:hypothetical protein [Streptomyces paludis]|uniref:Uncharacterized protein n=1 Tax=Streptomyces paludis TaxID=2282738 RepID=A0A345HZU4_9ACTN|nr:hypothetical protein [Streptomyces paludis]AXG82218.1 hypothetical protein DVK44_36055 [Streptomyces paludis]
MSLHWLEGTVGRAWRAWVSRDRPTISALFLLSGVAAGSLASRLSAMADGLRLASGQLGFALMARACGGIVILPQAGCLVFLFLGVSVGLVGVAISFAGRGV